MNTILISLIDRHGRDNHSVILAVVRVIHQKVLNGSFIPIARMQTFEHYLCVTPDYTLFEAYWNGIELISATSKGPHPDKFAHHEQAQISKADLPTVKPIMAKSKILEYSTLISMAKT